MAQYVTKVRTDEGDKQIDYNALANLPVDSDTGLISVSKGGTGADIRNTSVTITHINVASNSSSTCTYFPYLKMCFLRAYIKLSSNLAVGDVLDIIQIDSQYRPSSVTALAAWAGDAMLAANVHKGSSDTDPAVVSIRCEEELTTASTLYISGWFAAAYK